MDFFFFLKTEFSLDNKEVGLYLLRKREFRSQASAAPKPACFQAARLWSQLASISR